MPHNSETKHTDVENEDSTPSLGNVLCFLGLQMVQQDLLVHPRYSFEVIVLLSCTSIIHRSRYVTFLLIPP